MKTLRVDEVVRTMDNREEVDRSSENCNSKDEELSNEILWDAFILVLTKDFENTKIR